MTDETKAVLSEIIDVQGEVNRTHFEVRELAELLELMVAGDQRIMPDKERLHRNERLIRLASRIAESAANCLDKSSDRLDDIASMVMNLQTGPQLKRVQAR